MGADWGVSEEIWDWVRSTEQTGDFLRKTQILGWKILGFFRTNRADWAVSKEKSNPGMGKFGLQLLQQSRLGCFKGKPKSRDRKFWGHQSRLGCFQSKTKSRDGKFWG